MNLCVSGLMTSPLPNTSLTRIVKHSAGEHTKERLDEKEEEVWDSSCMVGGRGAQQGSPGHELQPGAHKCHCAPPVCVGVCVCVCL